MSHTSYDVITEFDAKARMHDGAVLRANLFRPKRRPVPGGPFGWEPFVNEREDDYDSVE